MGLKFDGLVCSSCNTLIEGSNFFRCNACQSVVHSNEHCQNIHRMKCVRGRNTKNFEPDFDVRPDVKDIFKY